MEWRTPTLVAVRDSKDVQVAVPATTIISNMDRAEIIQSIAAEIGRHEKARVHWLEVYGGRRLDILRPGTKIAIARPAMW